MNCKTLIDWAAREAGEDAAACLALYLADDLEGLAGWFSGADDAECGWCELRIWVRSLRGEQSAKVLTDCGLLALCDYDLMRLN